MIGGVAVALLAGARNTKDIDAVVLVEEEDIARFLESGASYGFMPRIESPLAFARAHRMLLLKDSRSGTSIDISLGCLAFERLAIEHAQTLIAEGIEVRVPTVDDLVVMKAVASRLHDLADIETLLKQHPQADRGRIRSLVAEFAEALDRTELIDRLEPLLTPSRKPRRTERQETDQ